MRTHKNHDLALILSSAALLVTSTAGAGPLRPPVTSQKITAVYDTLSNSTLLRDKKTDWIKNNESTGDELNLFFGILNASHFIFPMAWGQGNGNVGLNDQYSWNDNSLAKHEIQKHCEAKFIGTLYRGCDGEEEDKWRKDFYAALSAHGKPAIINDFLNQFAFSLTIDGLSRDGQSIRALMSTKHPILSKYLLTGRDYLTAATDFKLTTCDGEAVQSLSKDVTNLDQMINSFDEFDFGHQFSSCVLESNRLTYQDNLSNYLSESVTEHYSEVCEDCNVKFSTVISLENSRFQLEVRANGDIVLSNSKNESLLLRKRDSDSTNPALIANAKEVYNAANVVIESVKSYSETLINTRTKTPAERSMIMQAKFNSMRPAIQAALATIDEKQGALSLIETISIQRAMQIAFDYARYFERQILQDPNVQIDSVKDSRPESDNSMPRNADVSKSIQAGAQ